MSRDPYKIGELNECTADTRSTYEVLEGNRAIRFHPCGTTSYHPKDVSQRYCGRCHRFITKPLLTVDKPDPNLIY